MNKIFQITIDNYASPAFCSFNKQLYGTIEDIHAFIDALIEENQSSDLAKAFQEYMNGNRKVQYVVAHAPTKLIHPAQLIETKHICENNFIYDHENVWGFPYKFHCTKLSAERAFIEKKKQVIVAIRPTFEKLKIVGKAGDIFIHGHRWGYPCVYDYFPGTDTLQSRLFMVEKIFNYSDVDKAYEFFIKDDYILKECFDEVIADG